MKKIILLFAFVLFANVSFGQVWLENLPKTKSSKQLTFFDYQKAFNDYWKSYKIDKGYYYVDGVKMKAAGRKQFWRWEWDMEGQINPKTGEFPSRSAQEIYDEYRKKTASKNKGFKSASWTSLGTNSSSGGYAGIGRVNCIAFHPSDNNTYWIGAPAGGLWKTSDNGSSWTCLTDDNAVLGVSGIIIPSDYATSNTIYIATGDRDGSDNYSVGVLKSTDGGSSWNSTGLTYSLSDRKLVNKMLQDPDDDDIIIAATSDGVYKTTDGGTTWSNQLTSNAFIDMEYKPGNFSTLYGSNKSGDIYTSTNDGANWTNTLSSSGRRVELGVSANDATYVYAVVAQSDGGLYEIQKSTDSGANFTQVFDGAISGNNLLGWESDGSDSGGQGWYDLSINVSPSNANIVVVGGVNSWRSTNGGSSWSIINHWYGADGHPSVHADKHNHTFRSNGDLFEVNDGGIYISTDNGTSWVDKTNGIVISQMYKLGVSATVANEVITGLQDNGTKLLTGGSWSDVKGGDGMECLIDYTDVNTQYGTYVRGQITRTKNHWNSGIDIEPSGAGDGAWVTPYIIDPTDHETLYAGYADVWKTTNQGDSWTQISTMSSSDKLRSMAIAPSNTSVLYVADNNHIWTTTNGGTNWTEITGSLPVTYAYIKYITVKNDDPNTLWIAMSGYNNYAVFQSTDGGSNWTNISTDLPEIPAYSIVQNKQSTSEVHLYVGTELGVYFKKGSDNWIEYNAGLPNVKIGELEIYYDDTTPANSKLRAATYGRGLWETSIEQVNSDLATVTTAAITNITTTSANSGGNVTDEGGSSIQERGIVWGTSANPTITSGNKIVDGSATTGTYTSSISGLTASTTYHVRAYATNGEGTGYGADVEFTTSSGLPTVTTTSITSITATSASSGGNVTDEGGSSIQERGIVWSTTADPTTTSGTKIVDGSTTTGTYTSSISGLTASTTYHVRAYAKNGEGTAYGADIEFTTSCNVVNAFPYTENFEGGTLPDCWSFTGTDWTFGNGGHSGNPASAHGGSYNALFYHSSATADISKLITGQFDFTGVSNASLTFWHTQAAYSSDQDELRVYYKTSTDGSWTKLAEYTTDISVWTEEILALPNLSSDYYIAFEATGKYGHGVTIDDVAIKNTTSIKTLVKKGIKIFPNPSEGKFKIVFEKLDADSKIKIKDIAGKTIYTKKIKSKINEIDLTSQSKGIYFINFILKDDVYTSKIIIE